MEAPGLSNDRFGTPKITKSVAQVTATSGKIIKTTSKSQLASAHFTAKPKHPKQPTTNKLSKANELAQHSPLHAALFPRLGAGGRGRSP